MTKARECYRRLAEMIELGELEPGSLVSESGLIQEWGFGRTPLREALQRLGSDQLVQIHPGRGIQIPSNSVDEQLRRLEVRRALEGLAVALAAERATSAELGALDAAVQCLEDAVDPGTYLGALRDTQRIVGDAAHNDYLAKAMTPLQSLSRRFWMAHLRSNDDLDAGRTLHLAILAAIQRRDAEDAGQASLRLNDHLVSFTLAVAARSGAMIRTCGWLSAGGRGGAHLPEDDLVVTEL